MDFHIIVSHSKILKFMLCKMNHTIYKQSAICNGVEPSNLREITGLDGNEAKIYTTLLKLGPSTAMVLSRQTKIERTLVYRTLDKLMERGLASYTVENGTKNFAATSPEKLLLQLKEKEDGLKRLLPYLREMASSEKRTEPAIEIYRGPNGVKTLVRDILKLKKDYVAFVRDKPTELKLFFETFMKTIEREGVHERVLVKAGTKIQKSKNTQVRHLPNEYQYHTTTGICGNMVGIILWSEPFLAIKIESRELADTYRSYFELLWKVAKT